MNSRLSVTPKDLMKHWRNDDKSDTPFFINFLNSTAYPRDETFLDMLNYTMFTCFKFKSMTFAIMVLNTLVFVCCLLHGGIVKQGKLFEPTQGTLFDLGMNYAYFTRYKDQIHRLILSLFLYCDLVQFSSCQLAWAVYGSYVERLVGWKMLWVVSAISGIAGTILSCCLTPWPHVNGSCLPSCFLGFLFGYLLIKWDKWDYSGSGRWQMLGWLVIGSLFIFLQSKQSVLSDEVANLGSTLIGILCSFALIKSFDKQYLIEYMPEQSILTTFALKLYPLLSLQHILLQVLVISIISVIPLYFLIDASLVSNLKYFLYIFQQK